MPPDTVTFTKIQLCRGFEFLSGLERRIIMSGC